MRFKFHSLDSSNLAAVAYSKKRKVLAVRFVSGNIYSYYDVPLWEYLRLLRADSHGIYHARHIKDNYKSEYFDYPSAETEERGARGLASPKQEEKDLLQQLTASVDLYLQQRKKAK